MSEKQVPRDPVVAADHGRRRQRVFWQCQGVVITAQLAIAIALAAACGPNVEDELIPTRDRAEVFCTFVTDMESRCRGAVFTEETKRERLDLCMSSPRWGWTDTCGDIFIAKVDCYASVTTCEDWGLLGQTRDENGNLGPSPCAAESIALLDPACYVHDETATRSITDRGIEANDGIS